MSLSKYCLINSKKGNAVFKQLSALGVAVATLAIVLTVTFLIMSQGKDQIRAIEGLDENGTRGGVSPSYAWNATSELQSAVGDIPPWIPIVILTAIGIVLLGLIMVFAKIRG